MRQLHDVKVFTRPSRMVRNLRTIVSDGLSFFAAVSRRSMALAAENLFLSKQLALFREREKKAMAPTPGDRFVFSKLGEVWTSKGLTRYMVLFFIDLSSADSDRGNCVACEWSMDESSRPFRDIITLDGECWHRERIAGQGWTLYNRSAGPQQQIAVSVEGVAHECLPPEAFPNPPSDVLCWANLLQLKGVLTPVLSLCCRSVTQSRSVHWHSARTESGWPRRAKI